MILSWWRLAYAPEGEPKPTTVNQPILLSYLQLIETAVAISLRAHGTRFADSAATRIFLQRQLHMHTPFASEKLRETSPQSSTVLANAGMSHWQTALRERLAQFEYEDGFVRRWYPHGHDGIVVIDPQLAFGAPIISGTAIPIHIIEERFVAGETEVEIAEDFGLNTQQVTAALDVRRPKKRQVA